MNLLKKYTKNDMDDVKKIGVIMFGLLGDVILRTPVIRALKDIYPNAKIIALVDPIGKAVLEYNHNVDKIIIFDRKKESNKFKQNLKKMKFILQVRAEKFDLLVNLYNAGLSRPMVFLSGSKYKLGFCMKENRYLYNVKSECEKDRLKEKQSYYLYMISIIEPLSDKKYSLKPVFNIKSQILKNMKQYLASFKKDISKVYTLNLAASTEDKILEYEKYFYIVKYIYEKYGYIPAIVSNPSQEFIQQKFIQEYLNNSDIPYMELKALSLNEVASVIVQTKFFITPDTGLMHLALALDSYILTIFTYTHPLFVDPNNEKFIAIYEKFDNDKLYQYQNISIDTLEKKIEELITQL